MEQRHDEQLDRADFAQNGPKGHAHRTHTEVRVDEAVGDRSGEGPVGCGLSGQFDAPGWRAQAQPLESRH